MSTQDPVTGRYEARGSMFFLANRSGFHIDIQEAARYSTLQVETSFRGSRSRSEHILVEFLAAYDHPSVWQDTTMCRQMGGDEHDGILFRASLIHSVSSLKLIRDLL
jgi:hypothetical protein